MSLADTLFAIEDAARSRGVTPAELCARIGVSRSTYQRWKAGTTKPSWPAWEAVRRVALGFGVVA